MYFDNIIIIGSGKIACDCVVFLHRNNIFLDVIESKISNVSMLRMICKKNEIMYECCEEAAKIKKILLEKIQKVHATLIISANNEYIFSKEIVDRTNVTIINFHYSYLPDYRGMNIPTWVIFNNEKYTGITWHYVNSSVDAGEIIIQKKIELKGNETALDIVKQVMEKGKEAFEEFILSFLNVPFTGRDNTGGNHIYRRKQLPADGILDISKDAEYIIRLLRAYDYGPMNVMPRLKIIVNNEVHEINKYRIKRNDELLWGRENWKEDYLLKKGTYIISLKF